MKIRTSIIIVIFLSACCNINNLQAQAYKYSNANYYGGAISVENKSLKFSHYPGNSPDLLGMSSIC